MCENELYTMGRGVEIHTIKMWKQQSIGEFKEFSGGLLTYSLQSQWCLTELKCQTDSVKS